MIKDTNTSDEPITPVVAGQEIKPTAVQDVSQDQVQGQERGVPAATPVAPSAPADASPAPPPPVAAEPESDIDLKSLTAPGDIPEAAENGTPPLADVSEPAPAPEALPGAPPEAGGPSATDVHRRPVVVHRDKTSRGVYASIVLTFLVAGAAGCYGVFQHYETRADALQKTNDELMAKTQQLEQQVSEQTNRNAGKAADAKPADMQSDEISLAGGDVTMTVPKEWTKVPIASCASVSKASKSVCQDVLAVAPNDKIQADGTAKWSAQVAVYEYAAEDGDARNWYETKYDGASLASYVTPKPMAIDTAQLNGDSALRFMMVAGNQSRPDYTNAFHAVVHGKYGVVVRAQLQNRGPAEAYDHRATYGPVLQELLKSVKFKD